MSVLFSPRMDVQIAILLVWVGSFTDICPLRRVYSQRFSPGRKVVSLGVNHPMSSRDEDTSPLFGSSTRTGEVTSNSSMCALTDRDGSNSEATISIHILDFDRQMPRQVS